MENASKALLMAGAVLIGLLVISLAVLAYNEMSHYQKSKSDAVRDEQLAEFNIQYTQYIRDDIKGIDLVSVSNKVIDFNLKESGAGEIDYTQEITLKINMNNYQQKYAGDLFNKTSYTIKSKNDEFYKIISKYIGLERKYTLKTMGQISSNLESLKKYYIQNDTTNGKSLSQVAGTRIVSGSELANLENKLRNKDFSDIEKYSQYSEFKTAEFKGLEPKYTNKGQIKELTFQYIGN